jgi:predicted acetyltransferase
MVIEKCSLKDVDRLAELNKQLIEDEKSDNKMDVQELRSRMEMFLQTDYSAYFFLENNEVVGYALVNEHSKPVYLRQFLIDRKYRRNHLGSKAIELLISELAVSEMDIEVLSWNETGMKFWESCGFVERSRCMRLSK